MAVSGIASKWVLLIDDMESMRAQLRLSLASVGFARLSVVANVEEALSLLQNNHYDVILCDYALGDGTDGQQFLEYLRTNDIITRNTAFIMITAETNYERVIAAAECSPDDYILKPFTAAQFSSRMERLVEKQEYFAAIDAETDAKNWDQVIIECDKRLQVKDRYFLELNKIKCSALMRLKHFKEAYNLYSELLSLRPALAWAKLGMARASLKLGKTKEAKRITQEIMRENPQYMTAYDFMGTILATEGENNEALIVLQKARTVSPGTMSRIRQMSNLAVNAGKPEVAETVMRQALRKNKYSPVRQANDYVMLTDALVKQGKTKEALKVVSDAQNSFNDDNSTVILAATESIVHTAAGRPDRAAAALNKALSFGDVSKLPPDAAIAVANACLVTGKESEANHIMQSVLRVNKGNEFIRNKLQEVLVSAGKDPKQAHSLIEETITKDAIELNDIGVRKADAGQLDEASEMLIIAADRLSHDLRIVGNAALVLALDMSKNGIEAHKLDKCVQYRDRLRNEAPENPKLEKIELLLDKLLEQQEE